MDFLTSKKRKLQNFYKACEQGNIKKIKKLSSKLGETQNNEELKIFFDKAISNGFSLDTIKALDECGFKPDQGETPSFIQLLKNTERRNADENNQIVDILVKNGADINKYDKKSRTPLFYALNKTNEDEALEFSEKLIENGADVNKTIKLDNGLNTSLLFNFVKNPAKTKLLLDSGADINKDNALGTSPLAKSSAKGYSQSLKLLVKHLPDMSKNLNPLLYCRKDDDFEFLIKNGADINEAASNPDFFRKNIKTVKRLKIIDNHNIKIDDKSLNGNLLHKACEQDNPEVIYYLLKNKRLNPNQQNKHGDTPLQHMAKTLHMHDVDKGKFNDNRFKIIKSFLKAGFKPKIKNNEGQDFMDTVNNAYTMFLRTQAKQPHEAIIQDKYVENIRAEVIDYMIGTKNPKINTLFTSSSKKNNKMKSNIKKILLDQTQKRN